MVQDFPDLVLDFLDHERLALHLIQPDRVDEEGRPDVGQQLPQVHFRNQNFIKTLKYIA